MRNVEEYWTLEDLFYNSEDLSYGDVRQWVKMRYPHLKNGALERQVDVVFGIYDGWKQGTFFVNGDNVGLRHWRSS